MTLFAISSTSDKEIEPFEPEGVLLKLLVLLFLKNYYGIKSVFTLYMNELEYT